MSTGGSLLQRLFCFTIEGAAAQGFTLVVQLLSARQGNFHLDPVTVNENSQWNDREALFLDLARQTFDVPLVEEQATAAERIVTGVTGTVIRADVTPNQERLTTRKGDIALFDVDLPGTDRLDLGTEELDSRRFPLEKVVGVACFAVGCQEPAFFSHCTTLARTSTISGSNWCLLPRSMISMARPGLTVGR